MATSPRMRSIAILGAVLLAPLSSAERLAGKEPAPSNVVQPAERLRDGERSGTQRPGATAVASLAGRLPRAPMNGRIDDIFPAQTWVPPPAAAAAPAPVAPPFPYTYVGKFIMDDTPVVLLGRQDASFVVRSGETLEGDYRVDSITPELMTLTYLPLNQRQTLRLGDGN